MPRPAAGNCHFPICGAGGNYREILSKNKVNGMDDQQPMTSEDKIIIIRRIIIAGFLMALIFHQGLMRLLNLDIYPYNTFLLAPEYRFSDFTQLANRIIDPFRLNSLSYSPFNYLIMRLFAFFGDAGLFIFLSSFIVFWMSYIYKNLPGKKGLNKTYTLLVFSFMTYPFLFWFDRGNTECWLFVLLAVFIYYYQKKWYLLSLVVLALASALRLYALIFLILFILNKKNERVKHPIMLTFASTGILSIISVLFMKGSLIGSALGVWRSALIVVHNYAYTRIQATNTSLLALIKLLFFGVLSLFPGQIIVCDRDGYPAQQLMIGGEHAKEILTSFHFFYPLIALGIFIVIVLVMFKTKMPLWKQVAMLILSLLLLPQIAFGYRMVFLFIPMFLFINDVTTGKNSRYYAILFALLLVPKNYYYLYADVSIMSIINPILMIIFLVMIMVEEMKKNRAAQITSET
ncbi:MAG: hypothetical protein ABIH50_02865 [bacterium]